MVSPLVGKEFRSFLDSAYQADIRRIQPEGCHHIAIAVGEGKLQDTGSEIFIDCLCHKSSLLTDFRLR